LLAQLRLTFTVENPDAAAVLLLDIRQTGACFR
jgi:hypothetical protein